jgi:hypothetical protein
MSAFEDASMEGQFPPVPAWRPTIVQPMEAIVDRIRYYTNGARDFALFEHGTVVILEDGQSDEEARRYAKGVLHSIFNFHPDMNPLRMDDGNVLVQYNHPAVNVVLRDVVERHWAEIDERHQDALATHEVLITPLGPNKFDDFGKKALFGRCFMFMDAQEPEVVRIERKTA